MQQKIPYVLWLPSWYPNKIDSFDGDFIQRHAIATSLFQNIYVVHLVKDDKKNITGVVCQDHFIRPGLTERIIYFKANTSPASKLINNWKWFRRYKKIINELIEKEGLPEMVHVHVPWKSGVLALWLKRKYKLPFLVTEHWGIYNDSIKENYSRKSYVLKFFTSLILKQSSLLISASKYVAIGMNKMVLQKKFKVIFNAVNPDLFFWKQKETPVFKFIHVSNIVPLKNLDGIISAASILYNKDVKFELVIIGNKESDAGKIYVEDSALKNFVFFKGELSYSKVAEEMQQANSLILFSDIENSPCVICEALCCGLPVISSNVGGVPELVNEKNSMLVPAKDISALASAMEQMMVTFHNYNQEEIAEEARRKFGYVTIGNQISEVYKEFNTR